MAIGARGADAFCPRCDYPLFWAASTAAATSASGDLSDGLRRLPGTAGRVTIGMISCWQCREPNPVTGAFCVRCGADLSGPPPAPAPPPPAPVVAPPAPPRLIWPWALLFIVAFTALVSWATIVWSSGP
ncbi:hypothetical protein BH20ACT2_BH20ACT2_14510 [soil metagenome]